MQLYHAAASPFVRKVMVALHETGRLTEVEVVPAHVTPMTTGDAALDHNPLGKIPVLVRPDGPALYDSRVICRFLDATSAKPGRLYPERRLWEVLTLEATAEGIMEAAVGIVYDGRFRTPDDQAKAWTDAQWGKIARALDTLGDRWMSHLAGPPDAGQIAVGCALGYLDFRHADRGWRTGRDALAAWSARFAERPSMAATAPG